MATLYRKYRPQSFGDVIGQNHIKITLQNQIQTSNFAHAYLFCGPRAVGKTTLARILAKSLNCLNRKEGEHEPCDKCDSCTEISAGRSLDIVEIDAASNTGVDNVRENIIASSRISPTNRDYKVFIIDEVHMLSISAFNALLKTLEEPPANVIFVLCTTEVHKMPNTIISRCQRFDFKKIGVNDIVEKLNYITTKEEIKVDKEVLEAVARHSGGHMRDAESLLGQIVAIAGKNITQKEADLVLPRSDMNEIIKLVDLLAKKDSAGGIRLANDLVDSGVDLKTFISDLVEVLRKILIGKVSPGLEEKLGMDLGESLEIKVNELSGELSINELVDFLNKFMKVRDAVKNSFIIQLPLELAIVELCSDSTTKEKKGESAPTAGGDDSRNYLSASGESQVKDAPPKPSSGEIDANHIASKWNEVLAKIKKQNHSLSFILKVCKPSEVKEDCVCLAFKYKFHKDRLDDGNIKGLVEQTLTEVFGKSLKINTVVDENLDVANGNPSTPSTGSGQASSPRQSSEQVPQEDPGQALQESPGQEVQGDAEQGQDEGSKNQNGGDDEVIDNILKTFGGKVVG